MIRITFNNSDKRVVNALLTKGTKIVTTLATTLDRLMYELQAKVQEKLSGAVLQARTGKLRGSVVKRPTTITGGVIRGRVTAAGDVASYGVVQERGGEKTYDIFPGIVTGKSDKRALAFFPGGSAGAAFGQSQQTRLRFALGKRRGELRPQRFGEFAAAGGIVVRHVVHPPLPQRSFMATALEEMRARIISRIHESAAEAVSS